MLMEGGVYVVCPVCLRASQLTFSMAWCTKCYSSSTLTIVDLDGKTYSKGKITEEFYGRDGKKYTAPNFGAYNFKHDNVYQLNCGKSERSTTSQAYNF